jgi:hypothetical protein
MPAVGQDFNRKGTVIDPPGKGIEVLKAGFKDPPLYSRPKGFWCWVNGNFDLVRISQELEESKANGMGGYDIWDVSSIFDPLNKVPAGPPFMGEESTNAIAHAIREATRLNLEIGLMVASSWNSGGSWTKPQHGVQGILDTSIVVSGSRDISIDLPFPKLPESPQNKWGQLILPKTADGKPAFYQEVAILAMPNQAEVDTSQILELTDKFQNGHLTWQAPDGEWKITRYISTNLGTPLKRPSTNSNGMQIDHLSKDAQEAHLQFFIDKLQPKLGDLSKTALKYLYNDSYEINGPVWTPTMREEFMNRRGYDLIPFLPVLEGNIVQSKEVSDRFMYDFKMTLSDLVVENQYKYGVEFCNKYGLDFHAEAGGPGPPVHPYVPVESIRASGLVSVPRGEFWYNYPKYDEEGFDSHVFIKGVASAAHLYDQTFVEAESFTSLLHWQESWSDLKPAADQAFSEGLNRIVFHTSAHSPDAFGAPGYVYGFGTHMNTRQTWWPKAKAWIDYLARNSYLLQQGNFVGDVLYYYGDQAPNFAKQRHVDPSLGFGYDYDVINTEKLLELEVKDGKMVLPHGQEYALLVLPDQNIMPLQVLEKIEKLLQSGALVAGPKPEKTPGLLNYQENDKTLSNLADKLWSGLSPTSHEVKTIGKGKLYWDKPQRQILFENNIFPDFNYKGQDDSTSINFIHRRTEDAEIYFVHNLRNEEVATECIFRAKGKAPQLWIPETGEMVQDLIYREEEDSIRIALNFPPYDAFFIIFNDEKTNPLQKVIKDGKTLFPADGAFAELKGYQPKSHTFNIPGAYTVVTKDNKKIKKNIEPHSSQTISGVWKLSFPDGWKAPEMIELDKLQSWTDSKDDGVKYFSGIAQYEIDFEYGKVDTNKKYVLDLGNVRELADVRLNGDSLGIVWHHPFQLDITEYLRQGKNHLVLEVANEWNNRLVGDEFLPKEEKLTNTNITGPRIGRMSWDVPLQPAGLLGPVSITRYDLK